MQDEDPGTLEHQFTDDEPGHSICTGFPGHPTHDCEDGDGSAWTRGACHPPCAALVGAALRALNDPSGLTARGAAAMEAAYPHSVSFDRLTGVVSVRDCSGTVAGTRVAHGASGLLFWGLM
jgi:hypothetical protein